MLIHIYVEFSFFNLELEEWITYIDIGSEQIKPGMNEGDATKSAVTDGLKKIASRLGIASDLYNGLITWDKQKQAIIVPDHYYAYYEQKGWPSPKKINTPPQLPSPTSTTSVSFRHSITS